MLYQRNSEVDVIKKVVLSDEERDKLLDYRKRISQLHIKHSKLQIQADRVQGVILDSMKQRDLIIQKIRSNQNVPDGARWDIKMGEIVFFKSRIGGSNVPSNY